MDETPIRLIQFLRATHRREAEHER